MWRGNIIIGNSEAYVEAIETDSGMFKEWHGQGHVISANVIDPGEYDTELGVIIINHIDLLDGNFTFVGSGKPYIEL